MSEGTRLLAWVGGLGLVVAAVVVLAPGLVPVPRERLVAAMDGLASLAGLGGLAVLAGLVAVAQGLWSSTTPSTPPPLTTPDERGEDDTDAVVGRDFDERLAETGRVGERTTQAEATVREDLRRLAVDVYREALDCDWETAARAVEEGRWTDDPAAAAFVGGPDAPSVPLRVWFRDVLDDSGAFFRQTARTIRAIYALQDAAASGDRDPVEALTEDGTRSHPEGDPVERELRRAFGFDADRTDDDRDANRVGADRVGQDREAADETGGEVTDR